MRRLAMVACAAALVPLSTATAAGPEPHLMTGRWLGFFQGGIDDPNLRGSLELQVVSQDQRRFMGTLTMSQPGLPPNPCALEGTVSRALVVNAKGDCGGSKLSMHGRATEELEDGFIVPCIFEGRWTLEGPDGVAEGTVGLLHLAGGPTELATGHYEGSAKDVGNPDAFPVMADLMRGRTGEGTGSFSAGDASFDVFFDIAVHEGSESHGFALVGGGDAGVIFLTGSFVPAMQRPDGSSSPAMIAGRHALVAVDGSVHEGMFEMEGAPPNLI